MQKRNDERGGSVLLVVSLITTVVLLLGALGFAFWAFGERQDYKDRSDVKSAAAVKVAEEALTKKLEADFAEREKSPLRTYTGPSTYGSVSFDYPKTWSAYLVESTTNAQQPIIGYFKPGFVPSINDSKSVYALRIELVSLGYEQVLNSYDSQIRTGKLKAVAFTPPKLKDSNVLPGVRLDGELQTNKPGSIVLMKVRDKTLKISTDGKDFEKDFSEIVLPSISYTP